MTVGALVYRVPDVSCEHCRTAIVSEVSGVSGVESVDVDLDAKMVTVVGREVSDEAVRTAIDEAGYDIADAVP